MGVNRKCPKCGSERVQLSNEIKKHGFFYLIFFGPFYLIWIMIKWTIGLLIFLLFDWWMAIITGPKNKGYVWKSNGWFSGKKQIFYCHECGHNFRA